MVADFCLRCDPRYLETYTSTGKSHPTGSPSLEELGVVLEVVIHEGGDEEIRVVVPIVHAHAHVPRLLARHLPAV